MRADRLLSALLLLQAHGKLTGRELAARLEVSPRTAHRDMEALSAAGVPVLALRGARGGWQLDEEWRTQVPGLDEEGVTDPKVGAEYRRAILEAGGTRDGLDLLRAFLGREPSNAAFLRKLGIAG